MTKTTKFFSLVAITTALASAATLAAAECGGGKGPRHHGMAPMDGGGPGKMGAIVSQLDADSDGTITQAEIASGTAAHAAEIDSDGNGVISAEELVAMHQRKRQDKAAKHLAIADTNGDGQISIEEFAQHRAARLMRMDQDEDGQISPEEMRPPRARAPRSGN